MSRLLRTAGSRFSFRHGATVSAAFMALLTTAALAQVPATDVWVVDVRNGESPSLGVPRNITEREGYDNQPAFAPDGKALFYTSITGEQADIVRYDLATGERANALSTPESEYSPTPMDGGRALSVVRVEADGTQRLWRFPIAGKGAPALLLPDIEPVGYHAWIDEQRLILFVLGEPPTLELATLGQKETKRLASDIGRALARIPGEARMSFIQNRSEEEQWVVAVDPVNGTFEPLVRTRPGSEDVAWAPDGSLWTGDGSVLWRWRPGQGEAWQQVADLSAAGISAITRLAFQHDGKRLALVAERPVP